jgi:hypothetical protein
MSIGPHALYMSWNRIGGTAGPLLSRMNLAQIASGGPASVFFWIRPRGAGFVRAVQGLGETGYYASGADSGNATMAQLMSSPGDSPFLFTTSTLSHTAVPDRDYCSDTGFSASGFACPTGMGTPGRTGDDWANRQPIQGNVVQGATLGGSHHDQLWLAWTAGRGYSTQPTTDAWSQPHIQFDGYHLSSLSRLFEGVVYNPCCGIEFPYLNSNAEGDVGISFAYGGPTVSNRPGAGILVPATPPQVDSFFDVAVGDRINPFTIPAGVYLNRTQGDYTTIQPDGDNSSLFVTGGPFDHYDTVGSSTVPRDHWGFARFGFGAPPSPPHIVITSPHDGASFSSDTTESFHGSATDWRGTPINQSSELQWSEDGTPFGNGTTATLHGASVGAHTITLQATDAAGRVATATIHVNVTAPPPGGSPSVTIDAPIDGQNYPNGNQAPIQFTAHGSEASGAPLAGSDVDWTDTYTDPHGVTQHVDLGHGLSFTHTLFWNGSSPTAHTITITATDPVDHNTATDTVQITVGTFS